jgi:hypothetical protein
MKIGATAAQLRLDLRLATKRRRCTIAMASATGSCRRRRLTVH